MRTEEILGIVPCRIGSKGIPRKCFREIGGATLVARAVACLEAAGIANIVISTDDDAVAAEKYGYRRPDEFARDSSPMIDVVKDVLEKFTGPPDQIVVLAQVTQPLRQPKHIRAALDLLQASGADSVVSVVEVPLSHNLALQFRDVGGELQPWIHRDFAALPTRRQDVIPAYMRDGTVYAFRRRTVDDHGNIYGRIVKPLIIPADESCELDTMADWDALEARLR